MWSEAGTYIILESESDPFVEPLIPLKGNSEVHLHTPTKFGEDRSKDLGGDREQTDRQTNRQTDKRCSIYSMMQRYQISIVCFILLENLYMCFFCTLTQRNIPVT